MNQNVLIAIIVVLVLALVGTWTMQSSRTSSAPYDTDTVATTSEMPSAAASPAGSTSASPKKPVAPTPTFKSIFSQPGSHECKYNQTDSSGSKSNVIYIADGKMRGEFRTVAGATSAGTLMVYNSGYLYVWQEGKTAGMKSSITSISQLPYAIPTDLTSGTVLGTNGQNVSWDCHTWIKDTTLLAPPSYVTFR